MYLTKLAIFVLTLVYFTDAKKCFESDVIIQLADGKIRGRTLKTDRNISYLAFLDIPYAAPPVGDLRFKAPVPPEKWDGILNTTENRKICYQFGGNPTMINSTMEDEDCLYLNVYTPAMLPRHHPAHKHHFNKKHSNVKTRRPVLVYIYGGGLTYGNGTFESYGPDFWIDSGVLVVTMNYRLGPLGFLSTQDDTIPGNLGFKDQNLALQWIQKNIHLFGGDPNLVTISGQSAGGVSVGYHILSKKSRGLFSRVILQSGTPLCSWSYQKNAREIAYKYAAVLDSNFDSNSTSSQLLDFLKSVAAEQMKSTVFNPNSGYQMGRGAIWVGVTENPDNEESFFTDHVHGSLETGKINKVPILMGIMSEEAIGSAADLPSLKTRMAVYDNNVSLLVNEDYKVNDTDLPEVGAKIRNVYTSGLFQDHLGDAIRFISDSTMTTPSARHADLLSKYVDVYFYQFSYVGELGDNRYEAEGAERVQHTAELNYMWRRERNYNLSSFPEADLITQKRLLKLWTNFITFGNPTPEEDDLLNNVIWPKVSPENFLYLNINNTLQISSDPKQYKELKAIIDTYGNPPFDTY